MTQTAPENAGSYKKKSRKSAGQLNSSLYLQAKSSYDNDPSPFRMIQMMSLKHSS